MLAVSMAVALLGCSTPPERSWLLPLHHEGWVVLEHGVDGAPAPVAEGGKTQIRVPAGGRLQISTPFRSGPSLDRYQREDGTTVPTLTADRLSRTEEHEATRPQAFVCCGGIRTHQDVSAGGPKRLFEYFYVGTGPAGEPPPLP